MGRKNKLKRDKAGNKGNVSPAPAVLDGGVVSLGLPSFLAKNKRNEISKPTDLDDEIMTLFLPPRPDMALDPSTMAQKLDSLPPNKRTATSERLIKAGAMIDEIESLQKSRSAHTDENSVNIAELKSDSSYVKECVLWINAYISSDFRVLVPSHLMSGSPLPECWTHIKLLRPLDTNEPQLMNLDAISFVILLATAIRIQSPQDRFSLQIVHELHAHVNGGYDWLDFELLNDHQETKDLDESYLRFALASVGVKRARALYRNSDQRQLLPFQSSNGNDDATQSKSLLHSIQTFAEEQVRFRPNSPVGYFNLGWVSSQVKHNGRHPWTATFNFYNHMADCCLMANDADDDFYRAIAGVEVAMSLVLGAQPLVGYAVPSSAKVQVLRDIVTTSPMTRGESNKIRLMAPTVSSAREVEENEKRRVKEGVLPTQLEAGESVLVPHWDVRRIWNYAMQAYSRVEEFKHGNFVYGESSGWDIAESFLKQVREDKVAPRQYGACPRVGFERSRDKGWWPCNHCGNVLSGSDLKQCSVCKKAQYCSRECQKKAWKVHKRLCIPVKL